MQDISAELVSDLVGAIYASALDPGRWPDALDAVRKAVDYANASLEAHELPSGRMIAQVAVGIPSPWLERMADYSEDFIAAWGGIARMREFPIFEPIVLSNAVPAENYLNNRYYREWVQPQGINDAIGIFMSRDNGMFSGIGMGRHASAGPVTDWQLAVLRLLTPHLQRALTISRLLELKTVQIGTLESTLDGMVAPTILVDAALKVVFANQTAREHFEGLFGAIAHDRSLRLADAKAASALARLVSRIESEALGGLGQRDGVPMRDAAGEPRIIHILPLTSERRSGSAAVAALFITPALDDQPVPSGALAALYDLTVAETRVMELVARSVTPTEVAARLGIAPSTVKTHLLQVFAKTGCQRQAELVRLVAGFKSPA